MADNTEIIVDITANNTEITEDTTADTRECMADNPEITEDKSQATDNETEKIPQKLYMLGLIKRYSIQRPAVYERMKYLNITQYKEKNNIYLSAEQIVHMDGLNEYLKTNKNMSGYPQPEPTGPVDGDNTMENIDDEDETAITVAQSQITVEPTQKLATKRRMNPSQKVVATIVKNAQIKAAKTLCAENYIARDYIENPELLPEDLRAQIEESQIISEIDPLEYGDELMRLARQMGGIPIPG